MNCHSHAFPQFEGKLIAFSITYLPFLIECLVYFFGDAKQQNKDSLTIFVDYRPRCVVVDRQRPLINKVDSYRNSHLTFS